MNYLKSVNEMTDSQIHFKWSVCGFGFKRGIMFKNLNKLVHKVSRLLWVVYGGFLYKIFFSMCIFALIIKVSVTNVNMCNHSTVVRSYYNCSWRPTFSLQYVWYQVVNKCWIEETWEIIHRHTNKRKRYFKGLF